MIYFVDVVLPIPVNQLFTYEINKAEFSFIKKGMRVAVPFGKKKIYTSIVYSSVYITQFDLPPSILSPELNMCKMCKDTVLHYTTLYNLHCVRCVRTLYCIILYHTILLTLCKMGKGTIPHYTTYTVRVLCHTILYHTAHLTLEISQTL